MIIVDVAVAVVVMFCCILMRDVAWHEKKADLITTFLYLLSLSVQN